MSESSSFQRISLERVLFTKVTDLLVHISVCKMHGALEFSYIYQESLKIPG